MIYKQTGSAELPIDTATAKAWLNVTHDEDDSLIAAILAAAFSFAEEYAGCSFHQQDWELSASITEAACGFTIAKSPLAAFAGVTITDPDGTVVTLEKTEYLLTVYASRAIFMISNPAVIGKASADFDAVKITFSTDGGLPPHVESAIKMILAFQYENRGDAPAINNNSAPPEALRLLQIERGLFI